MTKLASLLALALASAAQAEVLGYSLLSADGAAPTPRIDGAIAYDAAARRIFLFGGDDGLAKNDLWSYSLAARRWEQLAPTGTPPPARFGHTTIFDPIARRVVVFGGQAGGFFSDVWVYDTASNQWTQLAANQAGPSRRYGHSAIYDAPRRRMVISHGFTDAGRFDDTWAFDLATNTWRDISPVNRPLRRCLHHAVYDSVNQRMLLYGGCASGFGPCPLGDLWAFDLVNGGWREITPTASPAPREHYGVAFDEAGARLLLFSGAGPGVSNDTWMFDVRTDRWQPVNAANTPTARARHRGAAITDRGTVVFFGGNTANGNSNDLWVLGPAFASSVPQFQSASIGNAFTGAAGGAAPGEILSIYGTNLGPIEPVTFRFDASGMLPTSGPGVDATFNGIAAPLYYASAGQLNVQVPYEVAGAATAEVVVRVNSQPSEPVLIPVIATRPNVYPTVWNEDGSVNSAANPAPRGSVVVLYATGQGVTQPASRTGAAANSVYPEPAAVVQLAINGTAAQLRFTGQAPGTTGVMQVNARLPEEASGAVDAVLRVGQGQAAPVRVFVR